jgi:hypothetical protein
MIDDGWISVTEAISLTGLKRRAIERLMKRGYVGVLRVPTAYPKVSRDDLLRVMKESVQPARST